MTPLAVVELPRAHVRHLEFADRVAAALGDKDVWLRALDALRGERLGHQVTFRWDRCCCCGSKPAWAGGSEGIDVDLGVLS